jgi:hypothetical protein
MGKNKSNKGKKKSASAVSDDETILIDPEGVRFTHARIRPFFTGCGKRISETLQDIIEGRCALEDIPLITVIEGKEGCLFSLNNRRLYLIKELRARGLLENNMCRVRTKAGLPRELERYTTERCSLTARVMKEKGDDDGDNHAAGAGSDGEESMVAVAKVKAPPVKVKIPQVAMKAWKKLQKQSLKSPDLVLQQLDDWVKRGEMDAAQRELVILEFDI